MKRFWAHVALSSEENGFGILLDGKPLRTPARVGLILPNAVLAEAVAGEWRAVDGEIHPGDMPLTGMANAATDIVAADPAAFATRLASYAESDLLCYRAEHPAPLVKRQAERWEPILRAVEQRLDIRFERASGINYVAQPPVSLARVGDSFTALSPFQLAALDPIVTISGSALLGLSLAHGLLGAEDAFAAGALDEEWQFENWGADAEASAALEIRRRLFLAAADFLGMAA